MDVFSKAASYLDCSRRPAQSGFIKLGPLLLVAALVLALGVVLKYGLSSRDGATGVAATQGAPAAGPREVDFGLVELNPGQATPITSYKNGGNMVLYAGEELRFQVLGDAPLPPIDLRVGDSVEALSGTEGKLQIAGPAKRPLPAAMLAQGSRVSLPGGAPPRVSVKVQVYGAPRPQ